MRSIFLHVANATREKVLAHLGKIAIDQRTHPQDRSATWLYPVNSNPTIYVTERCDDDRYDDPAVATAVHAALGGHPSVELQCDVSGRISGDAEVRAIVRHMLDAFKGVASDDVSTNVWTGDEIRKDIRKDGLRFFDCRMADDRDRQ
jgi:hypothetical protein